MIRATFVAGLALVATLAGCTQEGTSNPVIQSIQIGDKPHACLKAGDMNLAQPATEIKGALRAKLLTQSAAQAGVRIFITGQDVNTYGQVVLNYVSSDNACTLWSEGLTVQEYSQRVGLNPMGLSPFYEITPAPAAPVTPAPIPTPTATPTPGK